MGIQYGACHFYGVHVPSEQWAEGVDDEGDRIDSVVRSLGLGDGSVSVGQVTAGRYDQHMLFLCIRVDGVDTDIELGEYRISRTGALDPAWDEALRMVAGGMGYEGLAKPGWITVATEY